MSLPVVHGVEQAYGTVALVQDILAIAPLPSDRPVLTADQREELDRLLAQARGSLAQAWYVVHGRMPPVELAVHQDAVMGVDHTNPASRLQQQ